MLDIFVSLVIPIHNVQDTIKDTIDQLTEILAREVTDYELVLVDNGSQDQTIDVLDALAQEIPNLQIYCLSRKHSQDVAVLSGMEQSIGDYVVLFDPVHDDSAVLPEMLQKTQERFDVIMARPKNGATRSNSFLYNLLSGWFTWLFHLISGLDLRRDAPRYRLISRRVLNFILQHQSAFIVHLMLPVTAGFRKTIIEYQPSSPVAPRETSLRQGISRAINILISTTTIPIRLVTFTFTLAAILSLIYSFVVIGIYIIKENTQPGWTPLSLQLSGMFFLLSTALAMMSEYIIRISTMTSGKPLYYITREFRSSILTQEQRLNVFHQEKILRKQETAEPPPENEAEAPNDRA